MKTETQKLRSLVRELNSEAGIDGFYAPVACHNVRCNRARLRKGELECHSLDCSPEWFKPASLVFLINRTNQTVTL